MRIALLGILAAAASAPVWAKPQIMTPPLGFERNEGQTAVEVKYVLRGPSSRLFLTGNRAVLSSRGVTMEMSLEGANPAARMEGEERLDGAVNYFIGADSRKWHTSVPRYARVRYRNVYPGIDLVYYANDRKLEYDFVVAPGANPRVIRVSFKGQEAMRIEDNGDLVLSTPGAEVRQHQPLVYQERNGRRETLQGKYVLRGRAVAFEVAKYDSARPLVIDPVLVVSTYLGGSDDDEATGIAADASGNVYVTGWTDSPDFPTTAGAYKRTWADRAAYVSKISPDGTKLIYSTFLGGESQTRSYAIALNSLGQAFIAGSAGTGFPTTTGAYGTSSQGTAYVAKLSADGSKLLMSTTIRGGNEAAYSLAIDAMGAAYIAGYGGASLQTTPGAYQTKSQAGGGTGFIAKVAADGKSVGYVTYFDGNAGVDMYGLAVDSNGNAYVTGSTRSTNLKTTAGAPQPNPPGGYDNGFVFKLNSTGSGVVWGTYLGGSVFNFPSGLTLDAAGNVYVSGTTQGDFPTTPGAYQTKPCNGCREINSWLVKYNPQGGVVFSTLLGDFNMYHGGAWSGGVGPALDGAGNIYVMGDSADTSFTGTADAFKRTLGSGDRDQIIVAKIDPSGSRLLYGTFYGGTGDEAARGIAVDACGTVYITGLTNSRDLTVTAGAIQSGPTETHSLSDTFVAKFLQPYFTAAGVANAGSFKAGAIAPGEIITIFGCNIGPDTLATYHLTNNKFDSTVAQTRVLFDGVAAPILYAFKDQTSVVVPYAVAGKSTTQVVAEFRGAQSAPVAMPVTSAAPGIFTIPPTGAGQAAVLNSDWSVNASGNGVARGDYIMLFTTVGGESGQDGVIATDARPHPLSNSVTATIGGVSAQVLYAGSAPQLIWGMTQVNLVVPATVTPGNAVPLVVNIGGAQSQGNVTIAVK